ncbi:hypothetical protein JTB14_022281 [Gonioctena quinquepunctata]|nr:hypothetical protein JTB14_022281 [Gonioctena quinquepunctata]
MTTTGLDIATNRTVDPEREMEKDPEREMSAGALGVLAGVLPIDMPIKERGRLDDLAEVTEDLKRQERDRAVTEWQARWENNISTAQGTKGMVPDIEVRITCTHRQMEYFLTQFLTGYCSFRSFTLKMNKSADDLCFYRQQ